MRSCWCTDATGQLGCTLIDPRVRHAPICEAQWLCWRVVRTSLLLLHSELLPVGLHTVPQRHPEISLLLRRHLRSVSNANSLVNWVSRASSQRASIFANVGLEIAWAWRNCWIWQVVLGTAAARVARAIEVRIIVAVEWRVSKNAKGTERVSLRGTWSCQWVVMMTVVMVQGDSRACGGQSWHFLRKSFDCDTDHARNGAQ